MAGNERASHRMSSSSDTSMDEILASIRRIIAEDPIGSRPNPSTLGAPAEPDSLRIRQPLPPPQRIEPSLLPPQRPNAFPDRPSAFPDFSEQPNRSSALTAHDLTFAPPPAAGTGEADLDDMFETPAAPAHVSRRSQPDLAVNRDIPDIAPGLDSPDNVTLGAPDLSTQSHSAVVPPTGLISDAPGTQVATRSPFDLIPSADRDSTSLSASRYAGLPFASDDDTATPLDDTGTLTTDGHVMIAASPSNDGDVENLLSRLAASLSAQASLAPSDDEARRAVADAVAAVAAANNGSAPDVTATTAAPLASLPTEPVLLDEAVALTSPIVVAETGRPDSATALISDIPAVLTDSASELASELERVSEPLPAAVTKPVIIELPPVPTVAASIAPAVASVAATVTAPAVAAAAVVPGESAPAHPALGAVAHEGPRPAEARTLEDSVADMLRPLLREWLDVHMPAMLEKALREELAARMPATPASKAVD